VSRRNYASRPRKVTPRKGEGKEGVLVSGKGGHHQKSAVYLAQRKKKMGLFFGGRRLPHDLLRKGGERGGNQSLWGRRGKRGV